MPEHEIRQLIGIISRDLDRGLRRALRSVVVPAAIGVSVALAGCSDDTTPTDAQVPDTALVDGAADSGPADGPLADQQGPDQATDQQLADQQSPDQTVDTGIKWDNLPPPPYMAPDTAPLYRSLA